MYLISKFDITLQKITFSAGMESVFSWFKEYQLYQIAVIYMCTRFFVNISQSYIPLFIQVTLRLHAIYIATVPLAMFASAFATTFLMRKMNDYFGRKVTLVIGAIFGVTGCIWIEFGCGNVENSTTSVFFAAIFIGKHLFLTTSLGPRSLKLICW